MKPWMYISSRVLRPLWDSGGKDCIELDRGSLVEHCSVMVGARPRLGVRGGERGGFDSALGVLVS